MINNIKSKMRSILNKYQEPDGISPVIGVILIVVIIVILTVMG